MSDDVIYLGGCDPQILAPHDKPNQVTIRVVAVEWDQEGRARRSGKHIHLALTVLDAMSLMTMLQGFQVERKIGFEGTVTKTVVPPRKDQN